jgi:hypothetical protein
MIGILPGDFHSPPFSAPKILHNLVKQILVDICFKEFEIFYNNLVNWKQKNT